MTEDQSTTIGVSHDTRANINKIKSEIDAKKNEEVIKKLISQYDGVCLNASEDTVKRVERIKRRQEDVSEEELMERAIDLLEDELGDEDEEEEEE